jgi:peptide/nickel transport system permease protein
MRIFGYKPPLTAWLGMFIVASFVFVAVFAPYLAPFAEDESVGDTWGDMTSTYLFGTDNIGRDVLSRVIYGARTTMGIALLTTILSFVIGTTAGFLAATAGSVIDQVLSRFVDIVLAVPLLVWALIFLAPFGANALALILVIAFLDSTRVFRLARSVAINLSVTEYVEVAKLRGEGLMSIIFREMIPNALPPLITEFGLRYCFNFLFVAAVSFLGFGVQPPFADWGGMVRENAATILSGQFIALWPALAIALVTVGVNLIVDWVLSINARPSGAQAEL